MNNDKYYLDATCRTDGDFNELRNVKVFFACESKPKQILGIFAYDLDTVIVTVSTSYQVDTSNKVDTLLSNFKPYIDNLSYRVYVFNVYAIEDMIYNLYGSDFNKKADSIQIINEYYGIKFIKNGIFENILSKLYKTTQYEGLETCHMLSNSTMMICVDNRRSNFYKYIKYCERDILEGLPVGNNTCYILSIKDLWEVINNLDRDSNYYDDDDEIGRGYKGQFTSDNICGALNMGIVRKYDESPVYKMYV